MDLRIEIFLLIVGTCITIYLVFKTRLIKWIKALIIIFNIIVLMYRIPVCIKQQYENKNELETTNYYQHMTERQDLKLFNNLTEPYIDGLGEHPKLKYYLIEAQKNEKENNLE